jgi:peptidoglycan DL-endopeptidase CwlO
VAHRRRTTHLILITLATALLLPFVGAGAGQAAPSLNDAQREYDAINERVSEAVEDYNVARIELSQASRTADAAKAKVARTEASLKAARRDLGSLITSAYISGGTDSIVTLLTTASPQTFLDRATSLDQVARHREDQMRALRVASLQLRGAQDEAKALVANRAAVERRLAATRASITRQLARQDALVDRLSAEARARHRAAQAAARRALRATRDSDRFPTYTGPASGRAAVAIGFARRQLGKPYKWGGAGPNSYDCSGLTMRAWGAAGVGLPHSSRAQYNQGTRVSRSQLRPGDLVFFGSPIHHVGIYIGNGQMIAAPQSGDVVKVSSINRSGYTGAVRL